MFFIAVLSLFMIFVSRAFRTSGLFSVILATPPSFFHYNLFKDQHLSLSMLF